MSAGDDPQSEWLQGGCHCGRVRFRFRPLHFEALKCNCSICEKKGILHCIVPQDRFELQSGADVLTTYRFNTAIAAHTFCSVCGIHPFYTPRSHPDQVDVNIRCLDDGAARRFRVDPFDGKEWEASVDAIR